MRKKEYWTDKDGVTRELSPSMSLMSFSSKVISCPICRACIYQRVDVEKWIIYCDKIEEVPEDIAHGSIFQCPLFSPNKESMDYELVMKLMRENK